MVDKISKKINSLELDIKTQIIIEMIRNGIVINKENKRDITTIEETIIIHKEEIKVIFSTGKVNNNKDLLHKIEMCGRESHNKTQDLKILMKTINLITIKEDIQIILQEILITREIKQEILILMIEIRLTEITIKTKEVINNLKIKEEVTEGMANLIIKDLSIIIRDNSIIMIIIIIVTDFLLMNKVNNKRK